MADPTIYAPPPFVEPTITVAEACALVDAFGPEQQFLLHQIAIVLRREIVEMAARHDARVSELLAANNREVERRRMAERQVARVKEIAREIAKLAHQISLEFN